VRLRIPFVPLTFAVGVERRRLRRVSVLGLMIAIAGLALALGAVRLSRRWADDWAFDRREATRHRHEADFYARMLRDTRRYREEHPSDSGKVWFIHGLGYRLTPELDRYLGEAVVYHRRQAGRHERAVGRPWAYVSPGTPPSPPATVPLEEVADPAPKR
jgi:hypothetical protein